MNNSGGVPLGVEPVNFNVGIFQPMTVSSYSFNPGAASSAGVILSTPGIEPTTNLQPEVGFTVGQRDIKQRLNDREYHVDTRGWIVEALALFKRHWQYYVPWGVLVTAVCVISYYFVPVLLLNVPLTAGLYYATLNLIRTTSTGVVQPKDFLQGFIKLLPVFAVFLLSTLIIIAGLVVFVVPGIYAAVVLDFAIHIYLEYSEENIGILDSLQISYTVVHKKFWKLLLFHIALAGVLILGALLLGVGIIVAFPVAYIATCFAFRDIFGLKDHHQYSLTNIEMH